MINWSAGSMKCLKNFTMKINKKTVKKLITHNGTFHADDVFACVTLSLMLEKNGEKFKIIRTRDEKIIKGGDYVFDIGGYMMKKQIGLIITRQILKIKEKMVFLILRLVWFGRNLGKEFVTALR